MPRQPGASKTGGRHKGTPNKKTEGLRSCLDALELDVPGRIVEILPQLDPAKQVDVLLDLMNYLYPKRKAIEHSGPEGTPIQITTKRAGMVKLLSDPDALAALELLEKKLNVESESDSSGVLN